MKTVLLIGTLDTKGPEIAYMRDRLHALGVGVLVADSGVLGVPLGIVPDVTNAEVARKGGAVAGLGRGLVRVMPHFMTLLSTVGTAAMIWVGGQIVIHGMHELGQHQPYEWIHHAAEAAAHAVPQAAGLVSWAVTAFCDGVLGLILGLILIPVANYVVSPLIGAVKGLFGAKA